MWAGFFALIIIALYLDQFWLNGKGIQRTSVRMSLIWVLVWIGLAFVFNLLLWWYLISTGHSPLVAYQKAFEFLTGYLIEKSLSIDNMFVFFVIFNYFAVPIEYQRRVLFLGVLGAIVLRLVMILLGVWLIENLSWILHLFGVFLVVTGLRMLCFINHKPDLAKNPLLLWMRKHFKVTTQFHQEKFIVKKKGRYYVTPLFLVLVLIEMSDLVFAVDSIPAIFSVTEDPFIVLTSNIFAILGLRSLYFLLGNLTERFHLLKYGLAMILVFVGFKMLIVKWYKIPILLTLCGVLGIILSCVFLSSVCRKKTLSRH